MAYLRRRVKYLILLLSLFRLVQKNVSMTSERVSADGGNTCQIRFYPQSIPYHPRCCNIIEFSVRLINILTYQLDYVRPTITVNYVIQRRLVSEFQYYIFSFILFIYRPLRGDFEKVSADRNVQYINIVIKQQHCTVAYHLLGARVNISH